MRRISQEEFYRKQEIAAEKYIDAQRAFKEAEKQFRYEIDLILINYYGPLWLTDNKVGGWDEE